MGPLRENIENRKVLYTKFHEKTEGVHQSLPGRVTFRVKFYNNNIILRDLAFRASYKFLGNFIRRAVKLLTETAARSMLIGWVTEGNKPWNLE